MAEDVDRERIVEPEEYARLVGEASDEDLQRGLDENGELILAEIFDGMAARVRADATAGVNLVAEWRIRDVGDAGEVSWQVEVADGACRVKRDGNLPVDVHYSVRGVDFVKLVTGHAHGPRLFLFGRLKIRGDLLKAARFQGYFQAVGP